MTGETVLRAIAAGLYGFVVAFVSYQIGYRRALRWARQYYTGRFR